MQPTIYVIDQGESDPSRLSCPCQKNITLPNKPTKPLWQRLDEVEFTLLSLLAINDITSKFK